MTGRSAFPQLQSHPPSKLLWLWATVPARIVGVDRRACSASDADKCSWSRSMPSFRLFVAACCVFLVWCLALPADDPPTADEATPSKAVERLAETARKSVVIITV